MDNNNQNEQQDYSLADDLNNLSQYQYASTGKRFLNFVIDMLFIRYVISFGVGYVVGIILVSLAPDLLYAIAVEGEGSVSFYLFSYFLGVICILIYFTLCEKLFKGHTLGKAISGTRAIRMDGGELTFKDAFLRALCRVVPFEPFSGFTGTPWHDQWTNTTVINTR